MKFTKVPFVDMAGNKTVSFVQETKEPKAKPLTISASVAGLNISGDMDGHLVSEKDLEDFARTISDAWVEKRKLDPKIATNVAGH